MTSKKTVNRRAEVNLSRDDFDGGPVSFHEIDSGLFLGNLTAATHLQTLKILNITHILTMDSVPLPTHISQLPFLTAKYVHISDMPKEDILHHLDACIGFIQTALNNSQNVLVHCYFGVSRSSSIVIAFMMKKYNLEFQQAFDRVLTKRRFVQPNSGFIFQLKLYRKMGCKIDSQYIKYKIYRLRLAAESVKKAKILPQNYMDIVKADPGKTQEYPDPLVYRCRKCRRILAKKSNILTHAPLKRFSAHSQLDDNNSGGIKYGQENINKRLIDHRAEPARKSSTSERSSENENDTTCKMIFFIEPIAWMKEIFNQSQGRLHCPKCTQKLGNFSWINGCHCPCGVEVSPAFYLVPSKVELSHVVQNLQMTL